MQDERVHGIAAPVGWVELRYSRIASVLLAAFAVLICVRMPEILLKGRFWAEEGAIFFRNAWDLTPVQALLSPHSGYLNLAPNLATLAAHWLLPLSLAPYLTIAVALLLQLCPPLLLLTAGDEWLQSFPVRAIGLFVLLLVPASEEVWLTTICSQFILVLCCGIILSLRTEGGAVGAFRLALLVVAPLCGPVSIALIPLFLARALIDGSRMRLLQALALAASAAIQLLLFFEAVPGRGYALDPIVHLCIFAVRHLAVPFLGSHFAAKIAAAVQAELSAGTIPFGAALVPVLVFLPFGIATLVRRRSRPAFWLLAAGVLVAAASYFGALGAASALIGAHGGERYTYAPQALFGLAALALAATASRASPSSRQQLSSGCSRWAQSNSCGHGR